MVLGKHQSGKFNLEPISSCYVHIPFCSYKCDFCDFAAFSGLEDRTSEYFDALFEEIKVRAAQTRSEINLKSIYFGGGTPGLVEPHFIEESLKRIKASCQIDNSLEICLETTPHAVSERKLCQWHDLGVTRLSIGIESFADDELKSIGRDHTRSQAISGLSMALESAIGVVSIDFMYGLPTQSLESWKKTLSCALKFASENEKLGHISAYGLQLANKSPLYSRFPKDSKDYPSESLFSKMLECLITTLTGAGFLHYEVSNFAKPGFQCKHNSTYWKNQPYLAFGVGAHRYVDGIRSSNFRSFNKYVREPLKNEMEEFIDHKTRGKEALMLGLRMREGIDLKSYSEIYGIDLEANKKVEIKRLVSDGFLQMQDGYLSITDKGLPVSNSVIVELM